MLIKKVNTEKELQDAYFVRKQVFVLEQNIPIEIEIDEHEHESAHFIAYKDGDPIGAARVRQINDAAKVERVCVLKKYRRGGIGRMLMKEIEDFAKNQNWFPLTLHAQLEAVPFYEELGYKTYSELFYEANIPHVAIKKVR